jgi:hypothetical protein
MSSLQAELKLLRWPLLGLAAALLLALGIGAGAWHYVQQAQSAADSAEHAAAQMHGQAQRLRSEEQDTREKISQYQNIAARGIIGPERRLDWVELMRTIQNERKLLGLEYEILPQAPMSNMTANSGHAFMKSSMRVQVPLLHELDLILFLQDLRTQAPAYIHLRSCRLNRAPDTPNPAGVSPQLLAECQIDWVTLQHAGAIK